MIGSVSINLSQGLPIYLYTMYTLINLYSFQMRLWREVCARCSLFPARSRLCFLRARNAPLFPPRTQRAAFFPPFLRAIPGFPPPRAVFLLRSRARGVRLEQVDAMATTWGARRRHTRGCRGEPDAMVQKTPGRKLWARVQVSTTMPKVESQLTTKIYLF